MSVATVPISPQDKVSEVLDDSLVEVFVRHAPHFDKLRNRAMRRVMARLITVEQAAATAKIPVQRLVSDLNAALGLSRESLTAAPAAPPASATATSDDRHPANARIVEVDVRADLRSGREPFSRIMGAVAALQTGEVLHLRAIFEPAPLYTVLGKRGFVHESTSHSADDWSVWFWRPDANTGAPVKTSPTGAEADDVPANEEGTVYLDVRGLSPPEPMLRTLAALESLAHERTLVQINSRVPQFLLPMLAERGFGWEIDESRPDRVLVRISQVR
jgi:uncharacterized protein (DUF2249 family)